MPIEQEKSIESTKFSRRGKLTRVKQRGAAARYGYFRRSDLSKALRRLLVCSLLKSERRIEDGVLEIAPPESLNLLIWGGLRNCSWRTHALLVSLCC